jgi:hypothetical protein
MQCQQVTAMLDGKQCINLQASHVAVCLGSLSVTGWLLLDHSYACLHAFCCVLLLLLLLLLLQLRSGQQCWQSCKHTSTHTSHDSACRRSCNSSNSSSKQRNASLSPVVQQMMQTVKAA